MLVEFRADLANLPCLTTEAFAAPWYALWFATPERDSECAPFSSATRLTEPRFARWDDVAFPESANAGCGMSV